MRPMVDTHCCKVFCHSSLGSRWGIPSVPARIHALEGKLKIIRFYCRLMVFSFSRLVLRLCEFYALVICWENKSNSFRHYPAGVHTCCKIKGSKDLGASGCNVVTVSTVCLKWPSLVNHAVLLRWSLNTRSQLYSSSEMQI